MADAPTPLVSVIAICYNHARFLTQSLDSVAAQSYPAVELIVLDDCSTDDSVEQIRAWLAASGRAATVVVHESNTGICRSRNDALHHATGTYVSFLSTDDWWTPEKLAHQVAAIESRPDVAVVYSDTLVVDESGAPLAGFFVMAESPRPPPRGRIYDQLLDRNFIPPGPLVRLDSLRAVGPYDESLTYEDWDMWLRVAHHHDFAFSADTDVVKRHVPTSLFHRLGRRELDDTELRILLKHVGERPRLWRRIGELRYSTGHPDRRRSLWRGVVHDFTPGVLILWVCSLTGVSYDRACSLKGRLRDRFRRPASATSAGTRGAP